MEALSVHEEVRREEQEARERLRRLDRARRAKVAKAAAEKRGRRGRLREVESRMDALGEEYRTADAQRRHSIVRELRDLGAERLELRWGGSS